MLAETAGRLLRVEVLGAEGEVVTSATSNGLHESVELDVTNLRQDGVVLRLDYAGEADVDSAGPTPLEIEVIPTLP